MIREKKSSDHRDIQSTFEALKALVSMDDEREMPSWLSASRANWAQDYMSFSNGLIRPRAVALGGSHSLVEHTPSWFSTQHVNGSYDETADYSHISEWVLRRCQGDTQKADVLQEFAGYLLTPDTTREMGLILYGPSGTGKSTIGRLFRWLVSPEMTGEVALADFAEQFLVTHLEGKMLCVSDETTPRISPRAEERLKAFISGSPIVIRRIYQEPMKFIPTARIVALCNQWPQFRDRGIWRRWTVIPMMDAIDRRSFDTKVEEKLRESMAAGINWAIAGLRRLYHRGRFTVCEAGERILDDETSKVLNYRIFFEEAVYQKPGAFLSNLELWRTYDQWCKQYGYIPACGSRDIPKLFSEHFSERVVRRRNRRGISGYQVRLG